MLRVKDAEKSLDFYTRILGMEKSASLSSALSHPSRDTR